MAMEALGLGDLASLVGNPLGHHEHGEQQQAAAAGAAAGTVATAAAAVGAGIASADTERLAEDSNAVLLTDWFHRARKVLFRADGSAGLVIRSLPFTTLFRLFGVSLYNGDDRISSIFDPTAKDTMLMVVLAMFFIMSICFSLIVVRLSDILRPGGGLEQLGLGKVMIAESRMRRLECQRSAARCVQGLMVVCGGISTLIGVASFLTHVITLFQRDNAYWSFNMIPLGLFFLIEATLFLEFALTLQVAAALASDTVIEIVHAARDVSPEDVEEWTTRVVGPALGLNNGAVGLLADGWSSAIGLSYFGLWSMGLGVFAMQLYYAMILPFMVPVISFVFLMVLAMPIMMSSAVAAVSTSCDDLLTMLNERRVEDLSHGPSIMQLEIALNNLNQGQGLGIVINGSVLDKKKLRTMYLSVFGIFSTVIPMFLALNSSETDTIVYAAFENTAHVYAFSAEGHSFTESVQFCKDRWMTPVPISSNEEAIALVGLAGSQTVYTGVERDCAGDGIYCMKDGKACITNSFGCESLPKNFKYLDGRDYPEVVPEAEFADQGPYRYAPDIATPGSMLNPRFVYGAKYMTIRHSDDGDENPLVTFSFSPDSKHAVICQAPSLASIKGSIPHIRNLGILSRAGEGTIAAPAPPCLLSESQRAALKAVAQTVLLTCHSGQNHSNGTQLCSFDNISLGSILAE